MLYVPASSARACPDSDGFSALLPIWRIRYGVDRCSFVDGPFAETKDLIAGYTIIQVKSKEKAVEWTNGFSRRCKMIDNPVRWFEIYVQDMARARQFYESVFQVRLEKLGAEFPEMWAFPMQPDRVGAGGSLVKIEGVPSGGNSTIVYFGCEDCAVEAARAVAAGGRIDRDKMSIGQYGFIALVFDTEGNMFGLHSMK